MHCLAQCAAAWSPTAPAMRALSARPSSPPLQAAAASHATAAHCSTATSMSARACLTAWNWPMGRPNWTRTLAYSDAVSRHQRAIPALSAAASTCARPRTSSSRRTTWGPPAATVTPSPTSSSAPSGRVASRAGSASTRTWSPSRSRSSRSHSTPDPRSSGTSTSRAVGRPSTGRMDPPMVTASPMRSRGSHGSPSATAAVTVPSASPGSKRFAHGSVGVAGQGRGDEQRREDGSGEEGVPHLLDHDGDLGQREALAALGLGQVQSQPPLGGHLLPHRRRVRGRSGCLGHRPRLARRAVGLEPPLHGAPERLVLLGDGDRHYAALFGRHLDPVPPQRDGPHRATLGRDMQPLLVAGRRVEDDGVAVVAQVERPGRPEHAVARAHAAVPVDPDVQGRRHHAARSTMALVGTPSPEVTRQFRAPPTWLVEVPRSWRTPSVIRLKPCT